MRRSSLRSARTPPPPPRTQHDESHTWVNGKIKLLPVIQPDLGQPGVVVVDDARRAAGERVGRRFPEDVAHVRAGRDLQGTAAHPDLSQPG